MDVLAGMRLRIWCKFVREKQISAEGRQDILGLWQAPTYYAKTSRCQTSPVSAVAVCARQVCKFGRAGQTGKLGQVLLQAWEGSWGSSGEPWRRSEGAGRRLGGALELGRSWGGSLAGSLAVCLGGRLGGRLGVRLDGRILEGIWWLGPALPRRCPGANVVANCGRREAHT